MKRERLRGAARAGASLVVVAALCLIGVGRLWPPAPPRGHVGEADFSVDRALQHVREIAQAPRPVGSPENARVRARLVERLEELGFEVELQPGTEARRVSGIIPRAVVNVVGRLKGAGGGKALMLAAHYDSVRAGPGASDDAAGVAAILETARAVRAGPALRNDLIVLLTDGEEAGLLGAKAFVDGHRWARDVGLVLNFEARGTSGPSVMFETSAGNAWMVRQLAKAAPYPVFNSLSYDIYRLMPNNSDLTIFRRAGMAGMNFAYIGGHIHYHTARDDVEHLDVRSLWHHGSYALALTRHLGNADLAAVPRDEDAVYFNPLVPWTVVYSSAWAVPLAIGLVLIYGVMVAMGLRRRRLSAFGLMAGWGACVLSVAIGVFVVEALRSLLPEGHGRELVGLGVLGYVLLALAAASLPLPWLGRRVGIENLILGAAAWWVIAAMASALWLTGASYLALWPAVFALAGLGWRIMMPGAGSWSRQIVALIAAAPGILLLAPIIFLAAVALTLKFAGALSALAVLLWWLNLSLAEMAVGRPKQE